LTNVTSANIAIVIKDGAHHYDLRSEHVEDTWSVIEARNIEFAYILRWIEDFQK
jgi:hypothetical protein